MLLHKRTFCKRTSLKNENLHSPQKWVHITVEPFCWGKITRFSSLSSNSKPQNGDIPLLDSVRWSQKCGLK